jgi:hypothetical protein
MCTETRKEAKTAKTTHQPPSRQRWAAKHRAITIHADLELYDQIRAAQELLGVTTVELVRRALADVANATETARRIGVEEGLKAGEASRRTEDFDAGFLAAIERYAITYTCPRCGVSGPLVATPTVAQVAVAALRARGFRCVECRDEMDQGLAVGRLVTGDDD